MPAPPAGALSSRDEQDRSFRNATHDAAAAEASGQLYAKDRQAGTGGAQPLPAEAAEPRSAQPPDAALNKGPASAASSADGGPFEGPYQQGMPSSLRRQQGERREAERRLEASPGRLQRTRWGWEGHCRAGRGARPLQGPCWTELPSFASLHLRPRAAVRFNASSPKPEPPPPAAPPPRRPQLAVRHCTASAGASIWHPPPLLLASGTADRPPLPPL